jgi:hypothetical protein
MRHPANVSSTALDSSACSRRTALLCACQRHRPPPRLRLHHSLSFRPRRRARGPRHFRRRVASGVRRPRRRGPLAPRVTRRSDTWRARGRTVVGSRARSARAVRVARRPGWAGAAAAALAARVTRRRRSRRGRGEIDGHVVMRRVDWLELVTGVWWESETWWSRAATVLCGVLRAYRREPVGLYVGR